MSSKIRLGVLAFGVALAVGASSACQAIQNVVSSAGLDKGTVSGTVKDPSGNNLADAKVQVFKNTELGTVLNDKGVVDLEKLQTLVSAISKTTGADGTFKFEGLKITDGPFVVMATNKRGQDFRGVNRDTKKLFDVKLDDPSKPPAFSANDALFPNPVSEVKIAFVLPADTPPAPPPAAAPEVIPTPTPAPSSAPTPAPGSAEEVQKQSKLPAPTAAPNANFKNSVEAVKFESGFDPGTADTLSDGFKRYKFKASELGDVKVSSKVLIKATATGVTSATLRISNVPKDGREATVNEVTVSFTGGKLNSDNPDGYLFAVPRDGSKTVLQLVDKASGATSNSIALDGSSLTDTTKIRPFTVILTWDKGDGTDIDLHTYDLDTGEEAWFGDLSLPADKGSLDLDNTEGFGPETFTGKTSTAGYGISINYWYGRTKTKVKVRVITATSDKTYEKELGEIGDWWDVGKF
jgi:hypothetical protein